MSRSMYGSFPQMKYQSGRKLSKIRELSLLMNQTQEFLDSTKIFLLHFRDLRDP